MSSEMKNNAASSGEATNTLSPLQTTQQAALTKPGCSFFNMLVYSYDRGGYLLYRMDIAELNNNPDSGDNDKSLLPLLTFGPNILPENCTLVPLGDHLYFVGEKASDFFMIPKDDIKNLNPDENSPSYDYLLKVGPPMNGPKRRPLVFVAKENLYVFSRDSNDVSFDFEWYPDMLYPGMYSEMYSPSTGEWTVLESKPKGVGTLESHFVLDDKVYFGTTSEDSSLDQFVLSFNLTDDGPGRWSIVSTSPPAETFFDLRPAFKSPVLLIDDMLFGGFTSVPDIHRFVAASPYSSCEETTVSSFMRPTLAPSADFWLHLRRRFNILDPALFSDYYTALQTVSGQNVLFCITYGPSRPRYEFPPSTYAHFTFYTIPGEWWPEPLGGEYPHHNMWYYSIQKQQPGRVVQNHFKSEFMHDKLLKISTTKFSTSPTELITCFFY